MKLNKVKERASTQALKNIDSKAITCLGQHCTLPSVLVWTAEVAVSILSSYFQVSVSNTREINLKVIKVSVELSFRASALHCQILCFYFTPNGTSLMTYIWYDFPELQKCLACWGEMICTFEWCLNYFKYRFLGYITPCTGL